MRKAILGAVVAMTAFTVPAAASIPVDLGTVLAGSEVRRSIKFGDEWRHDVLKLHRDGTVTGNYEVRRDQLQHHGNTIRQGRVYGFWSIEHGALCVSGKGFEYKHKTCYVITKRYGYDKEFAATDVRTGDIWSFFIYPDARY